MLISPFSAEYSARSAHDMTGGIHRATWVTILTSRHSQEAGRFLLPTLSLSWRVRRLSWPQGCSLQLWELGNWERQQEECSLTTVTRSVTRDMSRGVALRHFITFQMMEPERVGGGKRWWGTGRKTFNLSRPQYLFDIYLHISCVSTSWTGLTLPDFFEQMRRNPSPGATKTL